MGRNRFGWVSKARPLALLAGTLPIERLAAMRLIVRAPVERAIAHLKSWRILHTDYRRPLRTYVMSYRAAVGLYFFKLNFE
jgi:hypothetical protein